jgi:cytochrome c-type biogenesis protein CcmH/NrfG
MAQQKRKNSSRGSTETSPTRADRARQEAPHSFTPTLNERLRKKGRWIFAFLAAVFALTFVVAGVGTGGPSMLDLLGEERAAESVEQSTPSGAVEEALAQTTQTPEDPQAWIALATAYVNAGQYGEVAEPAQRAAELATDDAAVQSAIADVYLAEAAALLQKAQEAYLEAQSSGLVGGRPAVPATVIPGQTQGSTPFQAAQEALSNAGFQRASEAAGPLQTDADAAYRSAIGVQERVTQITPKDPAAWFRLAQIAGAANDPRLAITAYQRFVELAPEDPLVKQVKEEIDRLEKSLAPQAG